MSTYKYEYLVTIPDHVDGGLQKRLDARPTHLKNLTPRVEAGQVVFGGATLSSQPKEGEAPAFTGSAMLVKANSEEEVRKIVEGDIYAEKGAWDLSKMTIVPFKCAVRTAL